MKRFSGLIAAASLGAAILAGAPAASASEAGLNALATAQAKAFPGESYSQWGGRHHGYGRGYYGGRGGYYGRRRGYGSAIGAGVAGLAAGALIGGAIASSQAQAYPGAPVGNVYGHDPRAVEYCAQRYRSYDPASGTFLANDGNRYSCP
jgi:hypothetical protein